MSTTTLGELVNTYGGLIQTGPFGSQLHQYDYTEIGIPVVMPKDIRDGRVDESGIAHIPERKAQQLSRHLLAPGSIVFPRRGDISKCAYIDEAQAGYLCGSGCVKIESPDQVLMPKFLHYYLGLGHVVEWLERNAVGTTMLNLSSKIIGRIPISLISLQKQERIVSILSAYDDLIENNRRRIALLEQAARLLYREWFVHLRFPGHEHVAVVDGVPAGWERITIGDIGQIVTGKTPSKKKEAYYGDDVPFIKTPDMHGNTLVIRTSESLSEEGAASQASKTLPARSVLVSCIGSVGVVSMNASPAQTNQQINTIVPQDETTRFWAFFMAQDLKPLLEGMGGGATMANVNKSKFSAIDCVLPSRIILEQFNAHVASQIDLIEQLLQTNLVLSQARDILLPLLMNGELAI